MSYAECHPLRWLIIGIERPVNQLGVLKEFIDKDDVVFNVYRFLQPDFSIAAGLSDGRLCMTNAEPMATILSTQVGHFSCSSAAYAADGQSITIGLGPFCKVVNVESGAESLSVNVESVNVESGAESISMSGAEILSNYDPHDIVSCSAYSPRAQSFAAGCMGGWLFINDAVSGANIQATFMDELAAADDPDSGAEIVAALVYSPDGSGLAIGMSNGFVYVMIVECGNVSPGIFCSPYLTALAYAPNRSHG